MRLSPNLGGTHLCVALPLLLFCASATAAVKTAVGAPLPVKADSLRATAPAQVETPRRGVSPKNGPLDTTHAKAAPDTIDYEARSIRYDVENKKLFLRGKARVRYREITLTADSITYNTQTSVLEAEGGPKLVDGKDEIRSEHMAYNVKTRWGKANYGTTRMEKGLYNGQTIRKAEDEILLVSSGDFSTCGIEDSSHYYFYGRSMKIIARDKVISRPVVMNIADVPVAALPFFVFPIKGGRRSGVLMPRFGGSEYANAGKGTRYLDNLGYYLAPNDYMDFLVQSKVTEFRDVQVVGQANYAIRDWLNGNVRSSMFLSDQDAGINRRWDFTYSHNQNLTPDQTFTLRGSGTLMGDRDYHAQTSDSLSEIINRRLSANLALAKRWPEKNISLSLSGDQSRDLISDRTDTRLPAYQFDFGSRLLIPPPASVKYEESEQKWFHNIYYGFSSAGSRRSIDSAQTLTHVGAQHSFRSRAPQKVLRHFTVSPYFDYSESWFDSRLDSLLVVTGDTARPDSFGIDTTTGFYRRGRTNLGVSANTRFYGIFPLAAGRFAGIRHTVEPTIRYNFSPEQLGGWHYRHVGMGDAGDNAKQKAVSMGISNLFQGKLQADSAQRKPERKFTFLNLGLSTGYNFAAKSRRMSDLRINANTNIMGKLGLTYNSSYSFYNPQSEWVQPWLTGRDYQASTGFRLSGRWWNGEVLASPSAAPGYGASGADDAWDLSVHSSYSYRLSRQFDGLELASKNYGLDGNASMKLTRTWKMGYSARYDFNSNQLVNQQVNLSKDLHCWQLVFNWTPTGPAKGYYFKVDIKEIPDLKIERQKHDTGRGYIYQ